jgi:hypothetical protein
MAENKHYGRQVVISLVLTIVILGAAFVFFGMYLIPRYQISREQIYGVMVKVFPFLIGIVMIQIGTMVAHHRDDDYADEVDKLPPNAYDSALYRMPQDDQSAPSTQNMAKAVPQVSPVIEPQMPPPQKMAEVEPVISPTVSVPAAETVDTSFTGIFENELKSAQNMNYDLTLLLVKTEDASRTKIVDRMSALMDKASYPFDLGDGTEAFVFPFYNQSEAEDFLKPVETQISQENPDAKWKKGFASRSGRVLSSDILLHEAEAACSVSP